MKILYIGCHETLEYDDFCLLTELDDILPEGEKLNIEVFSLNGAYMNPLQSGGFKRSVIPNGKFYSGLYAIGLQCDKDNIHDALLDWCDVIFMTHNSTIPGQKEQQRWVVKNFQKIKTKNKKFIWRSIGQSVPAIEQELKQYRTKGMNIVRYSPLEEKLPDFAGQDAMIRFYKDPDEFKGWIGDKLQVITVAQSFKQRGDHLGFAIFDKVTANFRRKVFGSENADLVDINGGEVSYQHLKNELKENRVFFYFGTIPAPYTLSFIEALCTGIPIVAAGPKLREHNAYRWPNYEIPDIITNGTNGYFSDSIDELIGYIDLLMIDKERAMAIGAAGRETAIKLFGKQKIMNEWISFLKKI
ncbi:MAG: hypothetical protein AABY22_16490 [Nanoarchaeota archaeon]